MKNTRTLYLDALINAMIFSGQYKPDTFTTLNNYYGVNVSGDAEVKVQYYGLGLTFSNILEHTELTFDTAWHTPLDRNLFKPIPFLVKEAAIGLSEEENYLYRMKVKQKIGNTDYILCYLKKFDSFSFDSRIYNVVKTDDEYDITILNNSDLGQFLPIPKDINCDTIKEDYYAISQRMGVILTEDDRDNLIAAINLLYPEQVDFSIGEVGIFHGKDIEITNEAKDVQASYFIQHNINLLEINERHVSTFDIGDMAPRLT